MTDSDPESSERDGSSWGNRFRGYMNEELTDSWGDAVLLLHCFVTGLLDSAVFNIWSCFVSMQTGNTVYIGLGVSGQPPDQPWRWCKSLVAVASFLSGAYVFSRTMQAAGQLRRGTVVATSLAQAILMLASAVLGTSGVVSRNAGSELPHNFIVLLPLALLSFQAAGQGVMSRVLGFGELPTVVITAAYLDLVVDDTAWTSPIRENPKRNRRAASLIILLGGAIAGGYLTLEGDINLALWVGGAIKLLISAIWLGWKSDRNIQLT